MIFVFSASIYLTFKRIKTKTTHTHNKYALSLTTVQKFTMPSSTERRKHCWSLDISNDCDKYCSSQHNTKKEEKSKPR